MLHALEVLPYSIATLKRLLARTSSRSVVKTKLHTRYFENYFKRVCAASIVIEREYIDRDFLEDFAGYYVRCFSEYKHKCARLHFFDVSLSQNDLVEALDGSARVHKKLQKSYLGFVVLKPLPQTIIGRTCLDTPIQALWVFW